jgi:hypothetical protein
MQIAANPHAIWLGENLAVRVCIIMVGLSLMVACDRVPLNADGLVELDKNIRRSEATEVHLASPPAVPPAPVAGLPFEVEGFFILAPEHQLLSKPKVSVLVGKVSHDQTRTEVGEQQQDGKVPFHGKLKCPKGTTEVVLRATFVVARKDDTNSPPRQIVIESKPLRLAVKEVGVKP